MENTTLEKAIAELGARVLEILHERKTLRALRTQCAELDEAYLMSEGEAIMAAQDAESDRVVLQAQTVDVIHAAARALGLVF